MTTHPDLVGLLPSWLLALRAERKSAATLESYGSGVRAFFRWCASEDVTPALDKTLVQTFLVSLLDGGTAATTVAARLLSLRRFTAWLLAEGELHTDPLLGIKPPKLDRKVVHALSDDQLQALIKACRGQTLVARRDEAIVRLMAETGMRRGEVLALQVSDVDLTKGLAVIRRGKGFKGRVVPFGPQTGTAIDRYVRMRNRAGFGDGPLWVGGTTRTLGNSGLAKAIKRRANVAGIDGFHLHLMRHTAATRWLRAGGSEQGLMSVAGWSTREMLDRYTGASAAERAAAEARGLNLGDL
jgi:site-specific recombinase XerD